MEMEREKYQYIEKAKYIQEQLVNFKTEIEDMKVSLIVASTLESGGVFIQIKKKLFFGGGRTIFFYTKNHKNMSWFQYQAVYEIKVF